MKNCLIAVVLSDGETWSEIDDTSIRYIDENDVYEVDGDFEIKGLTPVKRIRIKDMLQFWNDFEEFRKDWNPGRIK